MSVARFDRQRRQVENLPRKVPLDHPDHQPSGAVMVISTLVDPAVGAVPW